MVLKASALVVEFLQIENLPDLVMFTVYRKHHIGLYTRINTHIFVHCSFSFHEQTLVTISYSFMKSATLK